MLVAHAKIHGCDLSWWKPFNVDIMSERWDSEQAGARSGARELVPGRDTNRMELQSLDWLDLLAALHTQNRTYLAVALSSGAGTMVYGRLSST